MSERPIVKWANDEEMKAAIEQSKGFAFDSMEKPPLVIVLIGEEGSGKTHFGCTIDRSEYGPLYVIDTEQRAVHVAYHIFGIDKIIKVYNFIDMYAAVKAITSRFPKGTIMFDSGTDITKFSELRFLEEAKIDKIYPKVLYAEVYRKCNAVFDDVKRAGFNLIITARMKDEYVGENRTGKKLPKIYEELPYKADIVVQCNKDKSKILLKRPYGIDMSYKFSLKTTLPQLIDDLKQENSIKAELVAQGAENKGTLVFHPPQQPK